MNAQEFKAHMQLISVQAREDIEAAHIEADDLLCNQLSELGYTCLLYTSDAADE